MLVLLLIIINIQHTLHLLQLSRNIQLMCLGDQNCLSQQAKISAVFCMEANLSTLWYQLIGSTYLTAIAFAFEHFIGIFSPYTHSPPKKNRSILENEYFNLISQTMNITSVFILPLKLPEEFHIWGHVY